MEWSLLSPPVISSPSSWSTSRFMFPKAIPSHFPTGQSHFSLSSRLIFINPLCNYFLFRLNVLISYLTLLSICHCLPILWPQSWLNAILLILHNPWLRLILLIRGDFYCLSTLSNSYFIHFLSHITNTIWYIYKIHFTNMLIYIYIYIKKKKTLILLTFTGTQYRVLH